MIASDRPQNAIGDHGQSDVKGRILWMGFRAASRYPRRCPQNERLGDSQFMSDVLGYARVSTGDQDVAGQTMRLEEAGAIKVFTDVRSGKSMDRPGLTELLAYARKGDTLAVVRLDRLGRSLAELISIVEQLKARGLALLSLEEKIDTSSAAGELIFHVFGAIAHFERRLIAERTKDGIAAARARGKRPGRQPVDADKVQAALKLVEAGLSPTKAASQLGLGRSTVYREVAAAGGRRSAW
jgi:DNA invertase Pin-like site-specific DNA recombinase